jgi:diguanylate cyclase (GGDEF)-like protein
VLVRTARYKDGIDYLGRLMHDLAAAGLKGDMGAAKGSIGTAHLKLGQFQRAIEVFREGLQLLEMGSPAFQREIWDGIAAAHEALDQPREALAAFKTARGLEQKLTDSSAVASLEKHEMRTGMASVTAELARLADEDSLTGLANRRAAERVLRVALGDANASPVALLFIDIDHFKAINDRFGHGMGDRVLRECAQLMRHSSRSQDIAARWGGEEFLLILHGRRCVACRRDRRAPAQRRRAVRLDHARSRLAVTLSIGLASSGEAAGHGAGALLALADARVYSAQGRGAESRSRGIDLAPGRVPQVRPPGATDSSYFAVSSCVTAVGPFSLHETIPASRADSELYIWLVPMISPFPAFNTK